MYTITTENFFGIEKIKLSNPATGEYLSLIPSFGGNINELVLEKSGQLHSITAGDTALETLSGIKTNYYRGAKLSPFPNRINRGKYNFDGKKYQLDKNAPPHALHGLCWNLPFTVKKQICSDSSATLTLSATYQTLHNGYPFQYHIEIEYILAEHNFTCLTRLSNTSKHSIPIGDGWHPYFTTGSQVNTLKIHLPVHKQLELKALIPTGSYSSEQLFLTPTLLGNRSLDNCFELDNSGGIAETRIIDEMRNISIVVWQKAGANGYNYLQVYTPPDRKSIAIEPMTCAPDAFNNGKGLITLLPQEYIELSFGIRLI